MDKTVSVLGHRAPKKPRPPVGGPLATVSASATGTSITPSDELAGACRRLLDQEVKAFSFLSDRHSHRRSLLKGDEGWIRFMELTLDADGPAIATYWSQIIRLCGSVKAARELYLSYIALVGEEGW